MDSKYAHLNSSEDTLPPPSRSRSTPLILQTTTLLASLTTIFLLLFLPHSQSTIPIPSPTIPLGMNRINPSNTTHLQPCGTDAASARAAGCTFDLLTLAWLPPSCIDATLSQEFLEVASEPFYYDSDATQLIPNYDALSERPVGEVSWTTRKYHIYHCAFGWRLMHKMLERGGMLESGLSGFHHTEHCTDTLINTTVAMERVVTRAEISFPDC
ncbi:hypothetical protein ASPWEDRAFT_584250 [Aspergillus wentii DTO 134E9]|uniref:Uncharacterized protein n=1 Tax=Aspergillus wentii DTO 134E9 TaxID=1073089 RepID=A0A1L9RHQ1_ASPWE|nr:uncharacterized protein ASPWEDRAFT_584250 [Aspergillus wentii DTO 134E9]OJJ34470.1 hypothetical protein ASPWEDRAFT_584250 [Aspergillus wentii DTO 134E9]